MQAVSRQTTRPPQDQQPQGALNAAPNQPSPLPSAGGPSLGPANAIPLSMPSPVSTSAAPSAPSTQGTTITSDPQKLTTSVAVPPKEPWSFKQMTDDLGHYGGLIVTLYAAWTFLQKRLDNFSLLRNALRLNVRNIGIPHRGRYHCTGNSSTDEEVKRLLDAQAQGDASRNVPILISGPAAVGKFLIAKSIAAQLDLPLLKIDCAQLANTSAKIPPLLVTLIGVKVRLACIRHQTKGCSASAGNEHSKASITYNPHGHSINV